MESKLQARLRAVSLSDGVYTILSRKIKEQHPNACVLYIDEITCPVIKDRYQESCARYHEQGVHYFEQCGWWRATSEDQLISAVSNGFCAATGHVTVTRDATPTPRDKDGNVFCLLYCKFAYAYLTDLPASSPAPVGSVRVDNLESPSIFIVPNEHGVVPLYVVAFST